MIVPEMVMDKVYHCALDDTIDVLEELTRKATVVKSLFDVEVMDLLRTFHNRYGAKFSLYLFYEKLGTFNLSQVTDRFRREWEDNRDWLRLSFHARTKKPGVVDYYLYTQAGYEQAREDFTLIKDEILRFAGPASWEDYPRTHFWSGTKHAVRAWRDCGVKGLFYSYPGYSAMYFSEAQLKELWRKDFWYDPELQMLYIATNVKLPCLTIPDVEKDLAGLMDRRIIEIFADDYNVLELKDHMETAIAWAVRNNYRSAFYEDVFDTSAGGKSQ